MPGSYESIATVVVGAGGTTSIEFANIPQTYSHLQVRGIIKNTGGGTDSWSTSLGLFANSDTTSANYARHYVYGDIYNTPVGGGAANSNPLVAFVPGVSLTNLFAPTITDILDYANTNKYTTMRSLFGVDNNGNPGFVAISSGLWKNTAAVTNIKLQAGGNTFAQYSHFALYGVN
jgi:hypothetical protein